MAQIVDIFFGPKYNLHIQFTDILGLITPAHSLHPLAVLVFHPLVVLVFVPAALVLLVFVPAEPTPTLIRCYFKVVCLLGRAIWPE